MNILTQIQAPPALTRSARRRFRMLRAVLRNPSLMLGLLILMLVVGVAACAGWLSANDPLDMVGAPTLWPGQDPAFPLGTDSLGRDVAMGLAYGGRVSLLVGVSSAPLGLAIGTVIGATGGFFGGWVDNLLVRLTELFQTVP